MSEQKVEIHNPSYAQPPSTDALRKAAFPRLERGAHVRVAFLDNEKPGTTKLLSLVEAELGEVYEVQARKILKGGAGFPAPREMLEEVARSADVAIVSTAD